MITIYTHTWNPFTKEFWKWLARKLVGKFSGPDAVACSLVRGLKELKMPFLYNPLFCHGDTAVVLSGVCVLKKVIALKEDGRFKKLIAGPNIVISLNEHNSIIQSKHIDHVLVPSQWVAQLWLSKAPKISDRLVVWPAGVKITESSTRDGRPIIYDKLKDLNLTESIKATIGQPVNLFSYGSFDQKDYLRSLLTAPYIIYLSQSESQGIALLESWARNVPTFVYKSDGYKTADVTWYDEKINAPYLTETCGGFFKTFSRLDKLIKNSATFNPKGYCAQYLSDTASAKKLTALL